MPGMYDQGLPSAQMPPMGGALPQNAMQPGNVNAGRDRITQALMDVQNPPPITPMTQQQGMPSASGASPMAGAMPAAAAPQPMGSMPGQMPAAGGMPGQIPPLVGQGGAMPGLQNMMQPGGASPLTRPQTPAGGPTY